MEIQAGRSLNDVQPRRVAVGLEQNRLAILLAVLHRHGGLQMADQDVFVNVVGGEGQNQRRPGAAAGDSLSCATVLCRRISAGGLWRSGAGRGNSPGTERSEAYLEAAKHGPAIVPAANVKKCQACKSLA